MRFLFVIVTLLTFLVGDTPSYYAHVIEKIPTLNRHIVYALKDPVIPETVIHDTVPSHRGVQVGCSSVPMTALPDVHGYQYVKAMFYGNRVAGACVHLFSPDKGVIYQLLQSHGINFGLLLE